jgi:hypothetical protein
MEPERKNRRVFLLWQPSLHDAIKAEAEKCGESVNDYVHSVLRCAMNDGAFRENIRTQMQIKADLDIARVPVRAYRAPDAVSLAPAPAEPAKKPPADTFRLPLFHPPPPPPPAPGHGTAPETGRYR